MIIANLVGSPDRAARAERGERWPWLLAALDVKCGWCDRELRSCCCLDRPGPPARPLPDAAEFLANLPSGAGTATVSSRAGWGDRLVP